MAGIGKGCCNCYVRFILTGAGGSGNGAMYFSEGIGASNTQKAHIYALRRKLAVRGILSGSYAGI